MSNQYTIEAKELALLNRKSERQCRRIIADIKRRKGIDKNADLPLHVLCQELGWQEEKVRGLLR